MPQSAPISWRRAVKRRLQQLVEAKYGGVRNTLLKQAGIPHTTGGKWFRDGGSGPSEVGAYALSQIVERGGWSADYILTGKGPITRDAGPGDRLRLEVAALIAAQEGIEMEFLLDPRVLPSEDHLVNAAAAKVRPQVLDLLRQYRDRKASPARERQRALYRQLRQLLNGKASSEVDEFMAFFDDLKARTERNDSWLDELPSPDGRPGGSAPRKRG